MDNRETMTRSAHTIKSATTFNPRTPLGKRLWKLRQKIQTTEESLLDWDGVIREVQERRGEREDEAKR